MSTRLHIHLGKGQGRSMYNVGDVREVTSCIGIALTKVKEMRTVHNIREAEIVEDKGGNMPRINASLDNKKVEYQYPMIEVKGDIHNHPIAILIYFGATIDK
jgi:hypothetical protein